MVDKQPGPTGADVPFVYRPVRTLSEDQKAHRRAKSKSRVAELEAHVRDLTSRLQSVEVERDQLRGQLAEKDERLARLYGVRQQRDALQGIIESAYAAMEAQVHVDQPHVEAAASTSNMTFSVSSLDAISILRPPEAIDLDSIVPRASVEDSVGHTDPSPVSVSSASTSHQGDTDQPIAQHIAMLSASLDYLDHIDFGHFFDTWPLAFSLFPEDHGAEEPWMADAFLRVDHLPHVSDAVYGLDDAMDVESGTGTSSSQSPQLWATLPLNSGPICDLDRAVLDMERRFHDARHRKMTTAMTATTTTTTTRSSSVDLSELSTPSFPQVSSLLNPPSSAGDEVISPHSHSFRRQQRHRHGVTHSVVAHIMTQMAVYETTMRLAGMWLICHLVRWRLCRTAVTFAALPTFLHPTATQRTVPHPIWVDTIIWPEVRDRVIRTFDHSNYASFNAFRTRLGKAITVGWPHPLAESLTLMSANESGSHPSEYCLNKAFQAHLCDMANWTVDAEFVEAYPFLRGAVNVRAGLTD